MVKIRRGTIANNFQDSLKYENPLEAPTETSDRIVLTYDYSNVKVVDVLRISNTVVTGNATIYTTPSDEDFFLTSLSLGFSKNATCDVPSGGIFILATINGAQRKVSDIPILTLTAERGQIDSNFSIPIKIDRGTDIVINQPGAYSAGAMTKSGLIRGYTVRG